MKQNIIRMLIGWKIWVILAAVLATFVFPLNKTFTPVVDEYGAGLPLILWVWGNFDGHHYMSIARVGYEHLKYPFFPLFPLVMRFSAWLFDVPYLIGGLIVSHIAFIASLWITMKLLDLDQFKRKEKIVLLILAFPTSMFYGAVYNDSLFLLFVTWSILLVRKQQFMWAGIMGGLATLTRLNGLALLPFLAAEYWTLLHGKDGDGWHWPKNLLYVVKRVQKHAMELAQLIGSGLVILGAFFGYLKYVQSTTGSWNTIFSSMSLWQQDKVTFPPVVIWRYIKILYTVSPGVMTFWVACLEFFMVGWYVFLLVWSWRKIRFSYWVFFFVSILIPWLTGTFQGMPRYGLHLYPLFLSTFLLWERMSLRLRMIFLCVSLILQFFIIMLFTRGVFVT